MAQITSFDAHDQNYEKRKRKGNRQDVTHESQDAAITWCIAAEFS